MTTSAKSRSSIFHGLQRFIQVSYRASFIFCLNGIQVNNYREMFPQREIYEELDLSQSLASTILASLEERKLIRRFREGKENIAHIMEDM